MTPERRPGASTALLFRVGDDVELCDTAPPVRAHARHCFLGRGCWTWEAHHVAVVV
jgi:hypothetical protein